MHSSAAAMFSVRGLLADTLRIGIKKPLFLLNEKCPSGLHQAIWSSYVRWRGEGAPVHARTAGCYRVRIYRLGSYVVKEYTGGTRKVGIELEVLKQLQHECLVGFLFVADEGARISVFMDWAGNNLPEAMAEQPCAEELAQHITYQLTSGLAHLQQKGIVHRDIKPDNVAVQPDFSTKLFDWSEALLLDQLQGLSDKQLARQAGVAGTPLFMPPESLLYVTAPSKHSHAGSNGSSSSSACMPLRELTSHKLDIWGLGTVLYFLLAGRDILQADSNYDLQDMAEVLSTSRGIKLPPHAHASASARDFLQLCLHRDPAQRPSAQQLLQHPWLAGCSAAAAAAAMAAGVATATDAAAEAAENGGSSGQCCHAAAMQSKAAVPFSPPVTPSVAGYSIPTAVYATLQADGGDVSVPDTPSSWGFNNM